MFSGVIDYRPKMMSTRRPDGSAHYFHRETRREIGAPTGAVPPGQICTRCDGIGLTDQDGALGGLHSRYCVECDGKGFFGVDPTKPSQHPPGSKERVAEYCARYAAGIGETIFRDDDYRPPTADVSPFETVPTEPDESEDYEQDDVDDFDD